MSDVSDDSVVEGSPPASEPVVNEAVRSPLLPGALVRRGFAEFAVIVLGVLVALGIEASWANRQERAEESTAVRQLLIDFRSNALRLDTARADHLRSLEVSYALLEIMQGRSGPPQTESVADLVYDFTGVWTYDPVMGGLTSLIASGRLSILENDTLRVALAAWPDIVRDLNENEREEWRNVFQVVGPFFMREGVWADVLAKKGALRRLDRPPEPDLTRLLANPLFEQMVADRIMNVHNLMDEVETVDQAIDEIIGLLEAH